MKILDKKRLVFSFYLDEDAFEKEINKLHFKLLKRYINLFDEIIFCIIPQEGIDGGYINWLEKTIVEFTHKNIMFKIVENTNYRESLVFKNEIVDKMGELDGLTFFGHNKGISYDNVTEDTIKWILAMYYFNLEVELPYNGLNGKCFYGALKSKDIFLEDYTERSTVVLPKYNWAYCGTFFWGKYQEINNLLNIMGRKVPGMYSRWFDEMFPGNILEEFWGSCYGECDVSRKLIVGDNIDDYLYATYQGNEWVCSNFYEFCNNILKDEDIR
jgi:hypothetical protein